VCCSSYRASFPTLHRLSHHIARLLDNCSLSGRVVRHIRSLAKLHQGSRPIYTSDRHRRVEIVTVKEKETTTASITSGLTQGLALPSMSNEIAQPTEQDLRRSASAEGGKGTKPPALDTSSCTLSTPFTSSIGCLLLLDAVGIEAQVYRR
jgi:hypothetical protein